MVRPQRNVLVRGLALSGALALMLAACGDSDEPPPAQQGAAPAEQTTAGNLAN